MIFLFAKRLLILLEFFLLLRLILKFLGANPQAVIVDLFYKASGFFVSPFESIFQNIYWPADYLIETATVSAMIGYALALFIVFQILRLSSRDYL
jgi:hypothetical protein